MIKSLSRLMLAVTLIGTTASLASAQILLAPTRVVLEDGDKSADLTILNNGSEAAAFRISVENRRMLPNGMLETAEDTRDGELFANDMIGFSPRRVSLEPNAQQAIRISARLPRNIKPGEYRSHLRVMAAPKQAVNSLDSISSETSSGNLSIKLVAIQSVTIPIIIRVGELDGEVKITDVTVENEIPEGDPVLVAKLERTGDKSVYGDFRLFAEGVTDPVYEARGIAVYTPNESRDLLLPFPQEVAEKLQGKSVRIDYTTPDLENPTVLASMQTDMFK